MRTRLAYRLRRIYTFHFFSKTGIIVNFVHRCICWAAPSRYDGDNNLSNMMGRVIADIASPEKSSEACGNVIAVTKTKCPTFLAVFWVLRSSSYRPNLSRISEQGSSQCHLHALRAVPRHLPARKRCRAEGISRWYLAAPTLPVPPDVYCHSHRHSPKKGSSSPLCVFLSLKTAYNKRCLIRREPDETERERKRHIGVSQLPPVLPYYRIGERCKPCRTHHFLLMIVVYALLIYTFSTLSVDCRIWFLLQYSTMYHISFQ